MEVKVTQEEMDQLWEEIKNEIKGGVDEENNLQLPHEKTVKQLAEELKISENTARIRLNKLVKVGKMSKRMIKTNNYKLFVYSPCISSNA